MDVGVRPGKWWASNGWEEGTKGLTEEETSETSMQYSRMIPPKKPRKRRSVVFCHPVSMEPEILKNKSKVVVKNVRKKIEFLPKTVRKNIA